MHWQIHDVHFAVHSRIPGVTLRGRVVSYQVEIAVVNSVWTEAAKTGVLRAMQAFGVFGKVRDSEWRSARLLILCYHGISQADEHEASRELFMPASIFRQRLETLRNRGYTVVSLKDGLRRLADATLPRRSVTITFDDGFVDFHRLAYPLLREFGFPATVYVSTDYVERQLAVFPPILSYILWKGRGRKISGRGLNPDGAPLRTFTSSERSAALAAVLRGLVNQESADPETHDGVAAELATRLGVDYQAIHRQRLYHLMTPDEIREISGDLIDVQLHTHRHVQPRNYTLFAQEIAENKAALSRAGIPGDDLKHFCYPSGETRPELPGWLRDQGVVSATTCVPDIADATVDRLLVPRFIDTQDVTPLKFEAWLSGAAALLPKRRRNRVAAVLQRRPSASSRGVEAHQ
jgi:peptidoglycan/xylan/chitin deacetylase (PgdA/CDA1 family)